MRATDTNTALTTMISVPSSPETVPALPNSYEAVRFNALRHPAATPYWHTRAPTTTRRC